jgi:hypothetical protein
VIESSQHAPPARDFVGALTTAYRRNGADRQGEEGIAEQRRAREDFNPVSCREFCMRQHLVTLSL